MLDGCFDVHSNAMIVSSNEKPCNEAIMNSCSSETI